MHIHAGIHTDIRTYVHTRTRTRTRTHTHTLTRTCTRTRNHKGPSQVQTSQRSSCSGIQPRVDNRPFATLLASTNAWYCALTSFVSALFLFTDGECFPFFRFAAIELSLALDVWRTLSHDVTLQRQGSDCNDKGLTAASYW